VAINYQHLKELSHRILEELPVAEFYTEFGAQNTRSRDLFYCDQLVGELYDFVTEHIEDDFGHGLDHTTKVSVDAGALLLIETDASNIPLSRLERRVSVVQIAGLLHDMRRKQNDHATAGALYAEKLLNKYNLDPGEVQDIKLAISNHEAFKEPLRIDTQDGRLVSDCLYDADKFRWGPDNFTETVWNMVSYHNVPVARFMDGFEKGMAGIAKIKTTFRTGTGKKYGPQFIDMGLRIGKELLARAASSL